MMTMNKFFCTTLLLAFVASASRHVTATDSGTCMTMQLESMNNYFFCYDEAMSTKKPKLGRKICRNTMVDYLTTLRTTSCSINAKPKKIFKLANLCAEGDDVSTELFISTFAKCQPVVADVFFAFGTPKDGPIDSEVQTPEEEHTYIVSPAPPLHFHFKCGEEEKTCSSNDEECPPTMCADGSEPVFENGNSRSLRGSAR